MPREELEFGLTYYNSNHDCWIDIDGLLAAIQASRAPISPIAEKITAAIRALAAKDADLHHAQGREESAGATARRTFSRSANSKSSGAT
jgi:hypothetical protein